MDLLLTSSRDLSVTNGQLQITDTVGQAVVQRIVTRLQMFQGEWFLDTSAGTPYHQQILRAPPDMNALATIFRRVVSGDSAVIAVPTCVCSLASRVLAVRIVALIRTSLTASAQVTVNLTGGIDGALVVENVVVTPNGTPL